jgi:hypothetical protein
VLATIIGVIVGGLISIASQVTVDRARHRAEKKKETSERLALLRVQMFYFYSVQHLLKDSLETGKWWHADTSLNLTPSNQDIRSIASLIPDELWRCYSGSLRRISMCFALHPGAADEIPLDSMMRILGAYVTVDDLRRKGMPFMNLPVSEVALHSIQLTSAEVAAALEAHAGSLISRRDWASKLAGIPQRTAATKSSVQS